MRKFTRQVGSVLAAIAVVAASLVVASPANALNTAYYVDCSAGSPGSGTSGSPWNSLVSVNGKSGGFGAGDSILFRRGTTCTGQLAPAGSGSSGSPVTVDAWGTGTAPVIAGAGASSAISLLNQDYWTIQNIAVTNAAAQKVTGRGSSFASATAPCTAALFSRI